jgi:hypothetical protein
VQAAGWLLVAATVLASGLIVAMAYEAETTPSARATQVLAA